MLPSRISTIYNPKSNTFLGHSSRNKSLIFGFIDDEQAQLIKQRLKYDRGHVEKMNDSKYILKNIPKQRVLKPIDLKNTVIQKFTVESILIYVGVHNVELKLIDSLEELSNNDVIMSSNFYINSELELDNNVKRDILQNLFQDRRIL